MTKREATTLGIDEWPATLYLIALGPALYHMGFEQGPYTGRGILCFRSAVEALFWAMRHQIDGPGVTVQPLAFDEARKEAQRLKADALLMVSESLMVHWLRGARDSKSG